MERKNISVNFNFEIKEISEINKSFALAKVAIAYAGRNRNMSAISKDAFEKALPTLKNVPLVGRYDSSEHCFGGHDIKVISENNEVQIVNATTPFGVVPESANQYWEDVIEQDGTVTEYLFTDVILWKRQYGYDYLVEKKSIGQSMEISFTNYVIDQDGYCIIEDFEFDALCLIDCVPCFESASIQLFSKREISNYKSQFSAMIEDFKSLTKEQSINLDFSIYAKKEGGKEKLNQETINAILAEFKIVLKDLDFEVNEDMTEEDFRAKIDSFTKKTIVLSKAETYAATYQQKRKALDNACDPITVRNDDGNVISNTYFWVQDFDDEFVFVEKNVWSDSNDECSVGRFSYTFDETTLTATLTSEFEKMVMVRLTLEENEKLEKSRNAFELMEKEFGDLKKDFEIYKSNYSTVNADVEELRIFQNTTLANQREADEVEMFAQFDEKLKGETDYDTLKTECKELTLNEIREKCFSILGKKLAKFSVNKLKNNTIKIPVANAGNTEETKPYGDVYDKYLK